MTTMKSYRTATDVLAEENVSSLQSLVLVLSCLKTKAATFSTYSDFKEISTSCTYIVVKFSCTEELSEIPMGKSVISD